MRYTVGLEAKKRREKRQEPKFAKTPCQIRYLNEVLFLCLPNVDGRFTYAASAPTLQQRLVAGGHGVFSTTRIELAHRGFISMQVSVPQQFCQPVGKRLQAHTDAPDPVSQGRACQRYLTNCSQYYANRTFRGRPRLTHSGSTAQGEACLIRRCSSSSSQSKIPPIFFGLGIAPCCM